MAKLPHRFLRIPEQNVAHENIDGEWIIIHFESGNYFSLNAGAAALWGWVAAGVAPERFISAFQNPPPEAGDLIAQFLETLVGEGLLEPADAPAVAVPDPSPVPWQAPRFEKYNDMQQLLQADPIHEVDARGWPHLQAPAGE